MKLSIIIPVYNEESTVAKILRRVKKAPLPKGISREIIAIDDKSKDKSLNILSSIAGIKLFTHKVNKGKGACIRTGISNASGDLLLIQDADLEYDPNDYPKLIDPIIAGYAHVVYGTRFRNYPLALFGKMRTPLISHYLGNKFLTFVTNLLYTNAVTDMETGYKVIKRDVLNGITIKSKRFDFEPEITAKILKKGYKIYEVPIKVKPRGYKGGKKITWKDGIIALWTLVKYRFVD